jgi:hypothetical protein
MTPQRAERFAALDRQLEAAVKGSVCHSCSPVTPS